MQISPFGKFKYERNFPIDWQNDKCIICKFPLKFEPTNYQTTDDEMIFGDFLIRYEHTFWETFTQMNKLIILLTLKISKVTTKLFKNLFIFQLV